MNVSRITSSTKRLYNLWFGNWFKSGSQQCFALTLTCALSSFLRACCRLISSFCNVVFLVCDVQTQKHRLSFCEHITFLHMFHLHSIPCPSCVDSNIIYCKLPCRSLICSQEPIFVDISLNPSYKVLAELLTKNSGFWDDNAMSSGKFYQYIGDCCVKTLVTICQLTWHCIPEDLCSTGKVHPRTDHESPKGE